MWERLVSARTAACAQLFGAAGGQGNAQAALAEDEAVVRVRGGGGHTGGGKRVVQEVAVVGQLCGGGRFVVASSAHGICVPSAHVGGQTAGVFMRRSSAAPASSCGE